MKTTVYAWGAEKNNVLHIYAGQTTQKDITTRLNGVKNIVTGPANSWFVGPEGSTLGAYNLDLIYADTTQNYSRHKEQKAINAVWAVEERYRGAKLPVPHDWPSSRITLMTAQLAYTVMCCCTTPSLTATSTTKFIKQSNRGLKTKSTIQQPSNASLRK